MIKKGTSKQNIAIIVLSLLLLLSIIFGATYSYFNGVTGELISGTVTTATLKVEISGYDTDLKEEATFQLARDNNDENIVPGQPLTNTALRINNSSPVNTYMVVTYSLNIEGNNEAENPIDTTIMDAMNLKEAAVGDGWRKHSHTCKDGSTKLHTLVYLGNEIKGVSVNKGEGDGIFIASQRDENGNNYSLVLNYDCLVIPTSWGNEMQGKTISITFTAYVIQAEYLNTTYSGVVSTDLNNRTASIAAAVISEFNLDKTTQKV